MVAVVVAEQTQRAPPPLFRASRLVEPGVGAKMGSSFPAPPSHNAGAPHDVGGQIFFTLGEHFHGHTPP